MRASTDFLFRSRNEMAGKMVKTKIQNSNRSQLTTKFWYPMGQMGLQGRKQKKKKLPPPPACNFHITNSKGSKTLMLRNYICSEYFPVSQWYSSGLRLDDRGFESRQGLGIFLSIIVSRPALGLTQPPVQWVTGALSLRGKAARREADHSPPSSVEVKEWVELYLHSPVRLHGVVLN
jgi:hypothetical protein